MAYEIIKYWELESSSDILYSENSEYPEYKIVYHTREDALSAAIIILERFHPYVDNYARIRDRHIERDETNVSLYWTEEFVQRQKYIKTESVEIDGEIYSRDVLIPIPEEDWKPMREKHISIYAEERILEFGPIK